MKNFRRLGMEIFPIYAPSKQLRYRRDIKTENWDFITTVEKVRTLLDRGLGEFHSNPLELFSSHFIPCQIPVYKVITVEVVFRNVRVIPP